jgi:hypothetical protein
MTELIAPIQIMTGHTSPETAYVVDDYPYGYVLRCKIRYWIETASKGAKKGQSRFMSQTTNPKVDGEAWNKPKGGTYDAMEFMYLDGEGHVQHFGISPTRISPEFHARLTLWGALDQMDAGQRKTYDALLAYMRKYAEPWERFETVVTSMVDHIKATGLDPELTENGVWLWGDNGRAYISAYDFPVYVTTARNRLS